MYTVESRQQILDTMVSSLKSDDRITGIILVGSGVFGFKDEYSDIDMTVVVDGDLMQVYQDWEERVFDLLPVIWHTKVTKESGVYLYCFLVEDYLELDISFQLLKDLYARRPHWKVLHDSTGKIVSHMNENIRETDPVDQKEQLHYYLGEVWWFIVHAGFTIRRGHYIKAMFHIGFIRDLTIAIRGTYRDLDTSRESRFRDSDQLSPEFISDLEVCLVKSLEEHELMRALNGSTKLFFREAKQLEEKLGITVISELEAKMQEFLRKV